MGWESLGGRLLMMEQQSYVWAEVPALHHRLAVECSPGLQIQCLSPNPQTLFGRSQLRQEILEQNCKGNCLSVFFRSWFFFFPLFFVKNFVSNLFLWFGKEKDFFRVTNNLSFSKKKIIQRGESWPTTEFLFSVLLCHCHQHGECLFYNQFFMWRQGSHLFLPSQLSIASLVGYIWCLHHIPYTSNLNVSTFCPTEENGDLPLLVRTRTLVLHSCCSKSLLLHSEAVCLWAN